MLEIGFPSSEETDAFLAVGKSCLIPSKYNPHSLYKYERLICYLRIFINLIHSRLR